MSFPVTRQQQKQISNLWANRECNTTRGPQRAFLLRLESALEDEEITQETYDTLEDAMCIWPTAQLEAALKEAMAGGNVSRFARTLTREPVPADLQNVLTPDAQQAWADMPSVFNSDFRTQLAARLHVAHMAGRKPLDRVAMAGHIVDIQSHRQNNNQQAFGRRTVPSKSWKQLFGVERQQAKPVIDDPLSFEKVHELYMAKRGLPVNDWTKRGLPVNDRTKRGGLEHLLPQDSVPNNSIPVYRP